MECSPRIWWSGCPDYSNKVGIAMKKWLPLFLVLLMGCSRADPEMEASLEFRSRCLAASGITFRAEVSADYITQIEQFALECELDRDGNMVFTVLEPADISGISGTVSGSGEVKFDDTLLAFPLMAEGRLSPLSGPWVLMRAVRSGAIVAVGREGDKLRMTIDDSYADNALTVDIWLEDGKIEEAEIAWEGRRCLTMTVDDFSAAA